MTGACDWCGERGEVSARWLMAPLRHTAGAASATDARHQVARGGRMVGACAVCAPLVRARDVDGLCARARELAERAGAASSLSEVEHRLIFAAIDRALISEVADETQRPTRAQREAWAVAAAETSSGPLSPGEVS